MSHDRRDLPTGYRDCAAVAAAADLIPGPEGEPAGEQFERSVDRTCVLTRAPRWMQRDGLEWLYRLMQESRRLIGRYLRDLPRFAWLLAVAWVRSKR